MSRSALSPRFRLRWVSALAGLSLAGTVHGADLWTIAQDALENDAELASARSGFLATEAARDVQRGTLLPQISVGGNVSHSRIYSSAAQGQEAPQGQLEGGVPVGTASRDDTVSSVGVSLEAEQALYDPTRQAQLARAEREIDRDAVSLDVARQQLLFNVADAYFEILRAHDILSARRAQDIAISRQL